MKYLALFAALAALGSVASAQVGSPLPSQTGHILVTATAPSNGTSEVQTLTLGGTPTGGTFRLSFKGSNTAAIAWSVTNATLIANISAALQALDTVGAGGITVAAGTLTAGIGTVTLTYGGNLGVLSVPNVTVYNNSLTGTAPTVAVAETTPGVTADGRSQAAKGTLDVALDTGVLYANTGTALAPTWVKVSSQ